MNQEDIQRPSIYKTIERLKSSEFLKIKYKREPKIKNDPSGRPALNLSLKKA